LPTKDNIFRRGVIDQNSLEYVIGCGSLESSNHLLLHCNYFGSVWHLIYGWLGIFEAAPQSLTDHFIQFSYLGGLSRIRQQFYRLFGMLLCGKSGKNEITGCSQTKYAR